MRFDGLISDKLRREMIEIAREFRKTPTRSEDLLCQRLRGRQLGGVKFRRQQPIGPFIVDFYCDEAGLIVEVDGLVHASQEQADRGRQECLESLDLVVLRISATIVEGDMPSALAAILHALSQRQRTLSLRERVEPQGSG